MYWLDNGSGVSALPAPAAVLSETPLYATAGDPAEMIEATEWDADTANMVIQELLGTVNTANLTPSKTAYNQVTEAIRVLASNFAKTTGGPLGYAVSIENMPALQDGVTLGIEFVDLPNSADPTLVANSGATYNLYGSDGVTQIAAAGLPKHALVRWSAEADSNVGGFVVLNAASSSGGGGGGGGGSPFVYRYNSSFAVDSISGLPATGTVEFLQTGPALAVMTMDATKFTAGQVVVSILPMNQSITPPPAPGGVQPGPVVTSDTTIVSTGNVVVAGIVGAPQVLLNASVAQGVWQAQSGQSGACYGLVQSAISSEQFLLGATYLNVSSTAIACAWASAANGVWTLDVAVFNPSTKTLGAVTQFVQTGSGNAATYFLNPTFYSTGGSGFILAGWGMVVAGSVGGGGALSFGTTATISAASIALNAASFAFIRLSSSAYLAITPVESSSGGDAVGGFQADLYTVSGTTLTHVASAVYSATFGTQLASLPTYIFGTLQISSTAALVSFATLDVGVSVGGSALVLVTVSGSTISFTAQTNAPASTALYLLNSGSQFLAYGSALANLYGPTEFYGMSVSGTSSTAAAFSAGQTVNNAYFPGYFPGSQKPAFGQVSVAAAGSGAFLASAGGQLTALSVSGTALTVGTSTNVAADANTTGVVALADGTFFYQTLSGSQYTANFFTVSGDVITAGAMVAMLVGIEPALGPASSNVLFGGAYDIGGTIYPYAPNPAAGDWSVSPFVASLSGNPTMSGLQLPPASYTPIDTAGDHLFAGGGVFSQYA